MRLPSPSLPLAVVVGSFVIGGSVLGAATILANTTPHYGPVTTSNGYAWRLNQATGAFELCTPVPQGNGTKIIRCTDVLKQ